MPRRISARANADKWCVLIPLAPEVAHIPDDCLWITFGLNFKEGRALLKTAARRRERSDASEPKRFQLLGSRRVPTADHCTPGAAAETITVGGSYSNASDTRRRTGTCLAHAIG